MIATFNGTPLLEIEKRLPQVNLVYDKENKRVFTAKGVSNCDELRHRCVLCGKDISIGGSFSNQGHRLICVLCVYRYFEGDYSVVSEWQRGG